MATVINKTDQQKRGGSDVFVQGVHGVRYQVTDVARAVEFYTTHLGFTVEHQQLPAFASVSLGDDQILLSGPQASGSRPMPNGQRQEPGGWNRVVLRVTNLPAFIETLKKAGLRFGTTWRRVLAASKSSSRIPMATLSSYSNRRGSRAVASPMRTVATLAVGTAALVGAFRFAGYDGSRADDIAWQSQRVHLSPGESGAARFAFAHGLLDWHCRLRLSGSRQTGRELARGAARRIDLVVVRVIDDLPLRNPLRGHFRELLQQHHGEREVAHGEDAALAVPGDRVEFAVVVIVQPGCADDNMGAVGEGGKDVGFGGVGPRVFDEDVAAVRERSDCSGIDRAGDSTVTKHLTQVSPRVRPRHRGAQDQILRLRDRAREFRPGPPGGAGQTHRQSVAHRRLAVCRENSRGRNVSGLETVERPNGQLVPASGVDR